MVSRLVLILVDLDAEYELVIFMVRATPGENTTVVLAGRLPRASALNTGAGAERARFATPVGSQETFGDEHGCPASQ
jgi:hypothetical protein